MRRLICWVLGHRWNKVGKPMGGMVEYHTMRCGRCGGELCFEIVNGEWYEAVYGIYPDDFE